MNVNKININQSEPTYYIESGAYDVTANNSGITFSSLSALLSSENLSTLIPSAVRCGGMSIRFVQSSDNKYVQYRLMKDSFSTTSADWQGVDDEPTAGSENLVMSGGVYNEINTLKGNKTSSMEVIIGCGINAEGGLVENDITKNFCVSKYIFPIENKIYKWVIGEAITDGSDNGAFVFYDSQGVNIGYRSANEVERVIDLSEYSNIAYGKAVFKIGYSGAGIFEQNGKPIFCPIEDMNLKNTIIENKQNIDNISIGLDSINVDFDKSIINKGNIINYKGACLSPKFSVTEGMGIDYVCGKEFPSGGDNAAIVFYDADDKMILYKAANKISRHVTVPAGCVKARASFYKESKYMIGVYDIEGNAIFKPILKDGYQKQINQCQEQINQITNDVDYNVYFNHGLTNIGIVDYYKGICCSKDYFSVIEGENYTYRIGAAITGGSDNGCIMFFDSSNNPIIYFSANASSRTITVPQGAVKAKATFMMDINGVGVYDSNDNPVFVPQKINSSNELIGAKIDADVYSRNIDKEPSLIAACRFSKLGNLTHDLQLLLITDTHGISQAVVNAIKATNQFTTIDALVHCGDLVSGVFELGMDLSAEWKELVDKCEKPFYFIVGNHERQVYPYIGYRPTDEELYNAFIKPSVDAGHLTSGEYTLNKCYYYHDFTDRKIRMIVIDEGDGIPDTLDDTYWEAIPYNSELPNVIVDAHSYSANDEVNVPNYTLHSFRAKSNITAVYHNNTVPSYKYAAGTRCISQAQAQWFLDTLASTPVNYQVVVGLHRPFSDKADTLDNSIFNETHLINGYGIASYMVTDYIADAINAFQNKIKFSSICTFKNPVDMPSYTVEKDFTNAAGVFHSLIGGHVHRDIVWKHRSYNQYQIAPVCGNPSQIQANASDIRRSYVDSLAFDSITVASYGKGRIGLVKLGQNMTENGNKRDYEVLNIS